MTRRHINQIRAMRLAAKLSQKELAQRLGCTQGYICKIETTQFKVTPTLVTKVDNAIAGRRAGAELQSGILLERLWPPPII